MTNSNSLLRRPERTETASSALLRKPVPDRLAGLAKRQWRHQRRPSLMKLFLDQLHGKGQFAGCTRQRRQPPKETVR